jgi:hypothetical protein
MSMTRFTTSKDQKEMKNIRRHITVHSYLPISKHVRQYAMIYMSYMREIELWLSCYENIRHHVNYSGIIKKSK